MYVNTLYILEKTSTIAEKHAHSTAYCIITFYSKHMPLLKKLVLKNVFIKKNNTILYERHSPPPWPNAITLLEDRTFHQLLP